MSGETTTVQKVAGALVALLAVAGVAIGVYMTQHHEVMLYGGAEHQFQLVGCVEAEGVSCDKVNTSEWSELLSVPLFTWGIPFYAAVGLVGVLIARGRRELASVLAVSGVGAVLFSAFLYYISVVEIGSVCLWCIRLYGINAAILALSLVLQPWKAALPEGPLLGRLAGAFALATLVSVGAQRAYRGMLLGDAADVDLTAVAAPQDPAKPFVDPKGPAPTFEMQVKTEDGRDALLRVEPGDAWKGSPDAKVVIVEFADLECGYCKRTGAELKKVYEAYQDRVAIVFKHFPMDPKCNPGVKNRRHGDACNAGVAAVCAQEQGRFWAFHDLAFKNQHQLEPEHLATYAEKVGLDMAAYRSCVTGGAALAKVRADGEAGAALDVHGTPRVWINGQLYRAGTSAQQMARAIELALGKNAADATQAAMLVRADNDAVAPIPPDVPEMREIRYGDLHFFMDTFESGLREGKATSGKHEIPATRMSWFAGKDACEAAGKRLCSEEEWIAACQGARPVDDNGNGQHADDLIEGTAYPYSDYHQAGRCWDDKDRATFRPVYTGEMPGCASKDGVYDLTGNVEEWVGTSPGTAVLLGGAFDTSEDHARCYRRNDTFGAGYANQRTGFRCCRDPK